MNFIIGFIFGIVVVSVGFAGITKILDNGVNTIREVYKDVAK